jgi:hypothetical protein
MLLTGSASDELARSLQDLLEIVTMEISIHSLLEGATRATGTVAIIDVFRAFTTAAVALANRLEGRPGDAEAIRHLMLAGGEVGRFHDPTRPYLHPEDVDIALDIDRYDFAGRVEFDNGRPVARMERYG